MQLVLVFTNQSSERADLATIKTPHDAYCYAKKRKVNGQPMVKSFSLISITSNVEALIAKSAMYSYLYARYVLEGPFADGEVAIATNEQFSYLYAVDVVKDVWEPGEEAITGSLYNELYLEFLESL